jgi:hypothetical protein
MNLKSTTYKKIKINKEYTNMYKDWAFWRSYFKTYFIGSVYMHLY